MRNPYLSLAAVILITTLSSWTKAMDLQRDDKVRAACVAGTWYTDNPQRLTDEIQGMIDAAPGTTIDNKPLAVIAPHAGYRYSGPTAAAGYKCLHGHKYDRVVILAFSHRFSSGYQGADVPAKYTAYSTPLGSVPVDREMCDSLLSNPHFTSQPNLDSGEHSLELQLPFLQLVIPKFKLVPIYLGQMSDDSCNAIAKAILPWLDENTLLVASSDFTHYGANFGYVPFSKDIPNKLRELSDSATKPILHGDYDGFVKHIETTKDTICGRGPIRLLLRILSMQAGAEGVRAASDNSGSMTNDYSSSVSYESIVFTKPKGTLSKQERATLLRLARQTVTAYLNGQKAPDVPAPEVTRKLAEDGACFVTLTNHGQLRGCIGNMLASDPLHQAVKENAISACRDYRFAANPVTADELDDLHIEISYLTPMKPVENTDDIVVGRHGIFVTKGQYRGVLLPQVAYERGWRREEFLEQTCRKAGLPLESWKESGTKIESFEAEVFGE